MTRREFICEHVAFVCALMKRAAPAFVPRALIGPEQATAVAEKILKQGGCHSEDIVEANVSLGLVQEAINTLNSWESTPETARAVLIAQAARHLIAAVLALNLVDFAEAGRQSEWGLKNVEDAIRGQREAQASGDGPTCSTCGGSISLTRVQGLTETGAILRLGRPCANCGELMEDKS